MFPGGLIHRREGSRRAPSAAPVVAKVPKLSLIHILAGIPLGLVLGWLIGGQLTPAIVSQPVSYTHLDVYQRQL